MNSSTSRLLATYGCALALGFSASSALAQQYVYVPAYNDNVLRVVDTSTLAVDASIPVGTQPGGIAVTASGDRVYVANRLSNSVSVVDAGTRAVIATVPVGTNPVAVALDANGNRAYVSNYVSNTVSVIDANSLAVVATIPVGSRPQGLVVDSAAGRLYVANQLGDSVSVVNLQTNSVISTIPVGDAPLAVDISTNGDTVVVANNASGSISFIDTASALVVDTLVVGGQPSAVSMAPEGNLAYVSIFGTSEVAIISLASRTKVGQIPVTGGPRGITVSANGTRAYVGTQSNNRLNSLNLLTRSVQATVPVGFNRPLGTMLARTSSGAGGIGAGHDHTCKLSVGGDIDCFGREDQGRTAAVPGTYVSVEAGSAHSCGLGSDGQVVCWGDNSFGQLDVPVGAGEFLQISAGFRFTCGLRPDRSVICWGDNSQNQSNVPAGTYAAVSAGSSHACAINSSSSLVCWGRNAEGQATPPPGTYSQVAVGASFSCALDEAGSATCWGDNTSGRATPPAGTFQSIAAETRYACGIRPDGSVDCWGDDTFGQSSPPSGDFVKLALGRDHACGLQRDGRLDCWGDNLYSQAPRFDILPASLPAGELGQPYSQSVTFEVTSPSFRAPYVPRNPALVLEGDLPPGLAWDGAGNISGTPTVPGSFSFTVVGEDANGFHAEREYTISTGVSPPVITPVLTGTLGTNGWYVGNVTVSWTVVDPETPVTSTTGCGTTVVSADTAGTNFTCEATSAGGTASETVTVKLDKTRPNMTVALSKIRPLLNEPGVVATPTATDATSGIASATCAAVDTSVYGARTVTCTATDEAGNTFSRPGSYRVLLGFVGYTGGIAGPSVWNSASIGQLIDFQYQAVDFFGAGVEGLPTPTFSVLNLACPTSAPNVVPVSSNAPGLVDLGNGFYRFTWQAPPAAACQRLTIDLGDGYPINRALFQFNSVPD